LEEFLRERTAEYKKQIKELKDMVQILQNDTFKASLLGQNNSINLLDPPSSTGSLPSSTTATTTTTSSSSKQLNQEPVILEDQKQAESSDEDDDDVLQLDDDEDEEESSEEEDGIEERLDDDDQDYVESKARTKEKERLSERQAKTLERNKHVTTRKLPLISLRHRKRSMVLRYPQTSSSSTSTRSKESSIIQISAPTSFSTKKQIDELPAARFVLVQYVRREVFI